MNHIYVLDTHTFFWYLTESPRLSSRARSVFELAVNGKAQLILPTIVLLELHALLRKATSSIDFGATVRSIQSMPYLRIEATSVDDLLLLDRLLEISEIHDRAIAATAVRLDAILVTRDSEIRDSAVVKTLW